MDIETSTPGIQDVHGHLPEARVGVESASSKSRTRAPRSPTGRAVWGARGTPGPTDIRARRTSLTADLGTDALPALYPSFVRCGSAQRMRN